MDRAVVQGRQEPLRVGEGAGGLSRASFSPFDGAEHSPLMADVDGVAGGRSHAAALAHEGGTAWEGECRQWGLGTARLYAGLTILLLATVFSQHVGEYASEYTGQSAKCFEPIVYTVPSCSFWTLDLLTLSILRPFSWRLFCL